MQINFVSPRSHRHHPPSINHHSYSTQIVGDKSLKYFTDRKIRGLIPDSTFYPFQSPRHHQRSIICVSHVLGRMTATTTTLTVLEHRPVSSCCCCFHCSCHSKILFNPGQPCRWFWSLFGRGLSHLVQTNHFIRNWTKRGGIRDPFSRFVGSGGDFTEEVHQIYAKSANFHFNEFIIQL